MLSRVCGCGVVVVVEVVVVSVVVVPVFVAESAAAKVRGALLVLYAARGGLEALRYASLFKASFRAKPVTSASLLQ